MKRPVGFSLVELLVVVAIISVLAAILLPSLQKSLESARGVYCLNNQKQMGLFSALYANDNNGWLSEAAFSRGGMGPRPTRGFADMFSLLAYLNYVTYQPKTDGEYGSKPGLFFKFYATSVDAFGTVREQAGSYYKPPYEPVYSCPSWPIHPVYNTDHGMYGMRDAGFINISGAPIRVQALYSYIWGGQKGVPSPATNSKYPPSQYLLWGDSVRCVIGYNVTLTPYSQALTLTQRSTALTAAAALSLPSNWSCPTEFHVRHLGCGNGLFADGHGEALTLDALLDRQLGVAVYADEY